MASRLRVARHGTGTASTLRALASQVHPVFMLPPLSCSLFGAALAGEFDPGVAAVHVVAIFAAVYTAHVRDGYVDFYRRDEDDDHPLTVRGCHVAFAGATLLFAVAVVALFVRAGVLAAFLTLPTWFLGYLHAGVLDVNPVGATVGYPLGIALSLIGGYATQTGSLSAAAVVAAGVFLVLLSGVKIVDDAVDYEYDAAFGKRTVAVVLGRRRARRLAYALVAVALAGTLLAGAVGVFPPSAGLAVVAFGAVVPFARRGSDELATMLLVRASYLFLAALVVAIWFRPLAGLLASPPDIGVLGPYTYLATEVVFGAAAFVLLARSGALRSAARTILVLYPVAYVWDWYTLTVGVFSIPLRTGVEFAGIPVEEHLFIVVVPAFVLGIHETLRRRDADGE